MSPEHHLSNRYREVAVRTATPLQLVVILYDAAIQSLQEAQDHLKSRKIAERMRAVNRTISIISELQACLNFGVGGEIASSLDRLYNYMKNRIFQASVGQDPAPLVEVSSLLENLRSAWREVADQNQVPAPARTAPATGGSDFLKTGTTAAAEASSLNVSG